MAITLTAISETVSRVHGGTDGIIHWVGLVNLGDPYDAPGGMAVVPADFSAHAAEISSVVCGTSHDGTLHPSYDDINLAFIARNANGDEVANATNLSGANFTFMVTATLSM
jgi:hypothetical protein